MKNNLLFLAFICLIGFSTPLHSQAWELIHAEQVHNYQEYTEGHYSLTEGNLFQLRVKDLAHLKFSGGAVKSFVTIDLPLPSGEVVSLELRPNATMSPELQEKYPMIKSWTGIHAGYPVYVDYGVNGLHALIMRPSNPIYIDPVAAEKGIYIVYEADKFQSDKQAMVCEFNENEHLPEGYRPLTPAEIDKTILSPEKILATPSVMKTFRLALACTGEYARFHGGTTEGALSAMVTTMNRVNGIYRRDLGVQMQLIPDNDQIIFLDPNTDPYSNNSPNALLRENQTTLDNLIGTENYDIGHVFSTGGGGLAYLAGVCDRRNKARAETGLSRPIGDAFDVDYVAHEIGHQFGGNHSFNNSCSGNRSNSTAFEPGSGNSIMGYAGICAPDIQGNSNALFHGGNLIEMNHFLNSITCAEEETFDNSAPELQVDSLVVQVPTRTPFYLEIQATDADGDNLTYTWEQYDTEIVSQPPSGMDKRGPVFRGFMPSESPRRYIPSFSSLASSNDPRWEPLLKTERSINMGLTVRDNHGDAPRVVQEFVKIEVIEVGDGFYIQYPTGLTYIPENTILELTWEPGNLHQAPFYVTTVDVFLINNNGYEILDTLAMNIPNSGALDIPFTFPNDKAYRILIKTHQKNFFNISGTIAVRQGMDVVLLTTENEFCPGNTDTLMAYIPGKYTQKVTASLENLPQGLEYEVFPVDMEGKDTVYFVIKDNGNSVVPGSYELLARFQVGDVQESFNFDYEVGISQLNAPEIQIENYDQTSVKLSWLSAEEGAQYRIQYSSDEDFSHILFDTIVEFAGIRMAQVTTESNYFRYRSESNCAVTDWVHKSIESACVIKDLFTDDILEQGLWEVESDSSILIMRKDAGKNVAYMGTSKGRNKVSLSMNLTLDDMQTGVLRIPYSIIGNEKDCDASIAFTVLNSQGQAIAEHTINKCLDGGSNGEVNLSFICADYGEEITIHISAVVEKSIQYYFKLHGMKITACKDECVSTTAVSDMVAGLGNSAFCSFDTEGEYTYLTTVGDSMIVGINSGEENIGLYSVALMDRYYGDLYASANGLTVAVLQRAWDFKELLDCYNAEKVKVRLLFTEKEFDFIRDFNPYVDDLTKLGVSFISEEGENLNMKEKILLDVDVPSNLNLPAGILALDVDLPSANGRIVVHALSEPLADVWYRLRAYAVEEHIDLTWRIEYNEGLEYQILERSIDNTDFIGIDTIDFPWNQKFPDEFSYQDIDIEPKVVYYYRIKVVTTDGVEYTSPSVRSGIDITGTQNADLADMIIYPNPHVDYLSFSHVKEDMYRVDIYDSYGRKVDEVKYNSSEYLYDSSNLMSGVFYIRVYASDKLLGVKSFIKM